mgnify:CR=1 FL=1
MPPATREPNMTMVYLEHMAINMPVRLRRYNLAAQVFFIGVDSDFG